MRVALTGSTGLIGHAVAGALERAGHSLLRIGRAPSCDVAFDLVQPREMAREELAGCDALVHAAGVTDEDFAPGQRASARTKAVTAPAQLLRAAAAAGVPRLVYLSSAHVYGRLEGAIDESRPVAPASDYALAHLATEELFDKAGAASVFIARPCAVYGTPPALDRFARWSLIPFDFPRQALAGVITLKSAGLQERNFVGSDAIGSAVANWLASPAAGTVVANLPGRDTLSVYDFALRCARIAEAETGGRCEVVRPAPDRIPEPLEYRTLRPATPTGESLDHHIRAMIRALSQRASP
jgi:UDP-glucose 4-epimerase